MGKQSYEEKTYNKICNLQLERHNLQRKISELSDETVKNIKKQIELFKGMWISAQGDCHWYIKVEEILEVQVSNKVGSDSYLRPVFVTLKPQVAIRIDLLGHPIVQRESRLKFSFCSCDVFNMSSVFNLINRFKSENYHDAAFTIESSMYQE